MRISAPDVALTPRSDVATADASCIDERLTKRQLEVVALIVEGHTDQMVADALFIAHRTARAHVAQSMQALGARSRTQLAVYALRAGLVPLHPEDHTNANRRSQRLNGVTTDNWPFGQ